MAAYSTSPDRSPVKTRPVRLAPFAAGASPTIISRGRSAPQPGTGRPQYGWSANERRLVSAICSRHSTNRGQARHTDTSASSCAGDSTARAIAATCACADATAVRAVAGSPGQPVPGGTGESKSDSGTRVGEAHGSTVHDRRKSLARRAWPLLDCLPEVPCLNVVYNVPISRPTRRPIYLILFAALAAAAGNGISLIAFPWLVLQHNGSASDASIVAGAASLPLLFSTLIAGTAVDYLGRRRVSLISDALSGTTVAAVPVLALMFGRHSITVGVLAVLAALGALFDPAGITARESMLPEAATSAGWTLDRTNGFYEAIFNVAYIVGPGLGGLLIATIGGINTMWVTAGAFGVSIVAISALRLTGAGAPPGAARPDGPWSGMVDGLRFVWKLQGAAHAGADRLGNDRLVSADGKRAVPQVLHRPP